MFRLKLSIAISVLLIIILVLSATLYWGSQRVEYYSKRSQLAYDALESYVQLSHAAYRHFKELVDIVVLGGENNENDAKLTHQLLLDSLEKLKNATQHEITLVTGTEEEEDEEQELLRVLKLEKQLLEGIGSLQSVIAMHKVGNNGPVNDILSAVLDLKIDRECRPLIDEAINDEREEVEYALSHVER